MFETDLNAFENLVAYQKFSRYLVLAYIIFLAWLFFLAFVLVSWDVAPDSWFTFVLAIPTLTILLLSTLGVTAIFLWATLMIVFYKHKFNGIFPAESLCFYE